MPGDQIGKRIDDAEGYDERNDDRGRGYPEHVRAEKRDHGPVQSDHATDERVGGDEQSELRPVLAQAEPDGGRAGSRGSSRHDLLTRTLGGLDRNERGVDRRQDRKSTRLNSSHGYISYAVFCLKKKKYSKNCKCRHDLRSS